jgi:hypothetical protein
MLKHKQLFVISCVLVFSLSILSVSAFADPVSNDIDDSDPTSDSSTYTITSSAASTSATDEKSNGKDVDDVVVYAYTTADGNYSSEAADYGISYVVTIPQFVHLVNADGNTVGGSGTYQQNFDFCVSGEIGYAQTLSVVPVLDDKGQITLSGHGFALGTDVPCTVVVTGTAPTVDGVTYKQEQSYSRQDLLDSSHTNYTASAELSPGAWQGTMDVEISLSTNGITETNPTVADLDLTDNTSN